MSVVDHYEIRFRGGGPPLNDADLDECESRLSIRLPSGYRSLLLKQNGGRPAPGAFLGRCGALSIERLYSVRGTSSESDLVSVALREREDFRLPIERLPIGRTREGGDLLLDCTPESGGVLLYWGQRDEGFRENDPVFSNVETLYFPVDELLRKLGPPKNRRDRDGLFRELYTLSSRPAQGSKFARECVALGYDINFVLPGFRHPVFAALDADAFQVVLVLVELGTSAALTDPHHGGMPLPERVRETLE